VAQITADYYSGECVANHPCAASIPLVAFFGHPCGRRMDIPTAQPTVNLFLKGEYH